MHAEGREVLEAPDVDVLGDREPHAAVRLAPGRDRDVGRDQLHELADVGVDPAGVGRVVVVVAAPVVVAATAGAEREAETEHEHEASERTTSHGTSVAAV